MSCFTCKNGHEMSPSDGRCRECGERIAQMDGESRSEILARERIEDDETD